MTSDATAIKATGYRADIDGLRAVAVIPVVLYHAGVSLVGGGYVGVDVFFVISGFLISSVISNEIGEGGFSFVSFYDRRIRRIFPALFATALFTLLGSLILLQPKDLAVYGKSLAAMTFFVSNLFFRKEFAGGDGYFGDAVESQPLLHTWSLAVEEQFYIFFPVALIVLHRWFKRFIPTLLLLGVALSIALSVWTVAHKPVAAFYLLPPRAWELLIGAFMALAPLPTVRLRWLRELLAALGLGLILLAIFAYTKETKFPGFAALPPCLGACLLIYSGASGPTLTGRLLSLRPFVFIGLMSYSLYLWHWPIIVFAKYFLVSELGAVEAAACVALSLIAGFLSYRLIERPFRGRASSVSRSALFLSAVGVSAVSICIGAFLALDHGAPQRFSPPTRILIQANSDAKSDYEEKCSNFRADIKAASAITYCTIGKSQKNVLFMGDSHVQQLLPVVETMNANGKLLNQGVIFAVSTGCPPMTHLNVRDSRFHCNSFTRAAMQRALAPDIDIVFIGFSTWWMNDPDKLCFTSTAVKCARPLGQAEATRLFLIDLKGQVETLRNAGKQVIIGDPFPLYDRSIPDLQIHNLIFEKMSGALKPNDISGRSLAPGLESLASETGALIFNPRLVICPAGVCTYETDGVSWYKDASHLTASRAGVLGTALQASLAAAAARKN